MSIACQILVLGIPASSRYVDSCSLLAFHRWSFSSHQISGLQAWLVPLYPIKLAHPTVRIEVNIYFPSHIYWLLQWLCGRIRIRICCTSLSIYLLQTTSKLAVAATNLFPAVSPNNSIPSFGPKHSSRPKPTLPPQSHHHHNSSSTYILPPSTLDAPSPCRSDFTQQVRRLQCQHQHRLGWPTILPPSSSLTTTPLAR